MTRLMTAAVAAALLASSPAPASDFSQLGAPGFARSLLIRPERATEALCAAMALQHPAVNGAPSVAGARDMADAVIARLEVEIGDAKTARELVDGRAWWFDLEQYGGKDRAERIADAADFARQCVPLFEAYRAGGRAALEQRMLPSAGLIALLPMPYCVALSEKAATEDGNSPFHGSEPGEVLEFAMRGRTAAERDALSGEIDAARNALKGKEITPEMTARSMACLATFAERTRQLQSGE